jgi:hypothetical protein
VQSTDIVWFLPGSQSPTAVMGCMQQGPAAAAVPQVVKVRGEAMAAAAAAGGRRHGMLSVVGLSDELLEQLAARACQELGGGTMCQLANYLFPTVSSAPATGAWRWVTEAWLMLGKLCLPGLPHAVLKQAALSHHKRLPKLVTGC